RSSCHLLLLRRFNHALERAAQRRGVRGVRLELQRSENATADGDDVGVARPAGDGEPIGHLDDQNAAEIDGGSRESRALKTDPWVVFAAVLAERFTKNT